MKKNYLRKNKYGLVGLLCILALTFISCDGVPILGVWEVGSQDMEISVGDFTFPFSFNFLDMMDINVLMEFTPDTKSMYFEQDGVILKCVSLDKAYEIIADKIVVEDEGGPTEWTFDLTDGVLTITMTRDLLGYGDIPDFGLDMTVTTTWVLQQVDPSIVDGADSSDCVGSPLDSDSTEHSDFLLWTLI